MGDLYEESKVFDFCGQEIERGSTNAHGHDWCREPMLSPAITAIDAIFTMKTEQMVAL